MKQFTTVIVFFLVVATTCFAATGKPNMVIDQETFDAGEVIRMGPPVEHAFTVKNTGTADLKIFSVQPG
jgi:Protein of unknown function (DUF1573)